ncbi:hypothetical protein [Saccharothrix sp.]|nr:hypothetical protein [Saccharothrix sp.]
MCDLTIVHPPITGAATASSPAAQMIRTADSALADCDPPEKNRRV